MKKSNSFSKNESYRPRNKKEEQLIEALFLCKTKEEIVFFLRDILTLAEIEEFSNRLEMAILLKKGYSYLDVAKQTGASTTTVTRVAHWLHNGCGGYDSVINKLLK